MKAGSILENDNNKERVSESDNCRVSVGKGREKRKEYYAIKHVDVTHVNGQDKLRKIARRALRQMRYTLRKCFDAFAFVDELVMRVSSFYLICEVMSGIISE